MSRQSFVTVVFVLLVVVSCFGGETSSPEEAVRLLRSPSPADGIAAPRILFDSGEAALPALVSAFSDRTPSGALCGSSILGNQDPVFEGSEEFLKEPIPTRDITVREVALYLVMAIEKEDRYFAEGCRVCTPDEMDERLSLVLDEVARLYVSYQSGMGDFDASELQAIMTRHGCIFREICLDDEGDWTLALDLWSSLAEKGDPGAQSAVGYLYLHGLGVDLDKSRARMFYERAALQGYAKAQRILGTMYMFGEGGARDPVKGMDWIERAIDGADAPAALVKGQLYLDGDLIQRDCDQALAGFMAAAKMGSHRAEKTIGEMYLKGNCVPKDPEMAASWLRRAAVGGDHRSQVQLYEMYWSGMGVEKDRIEAWKWALIAFPDWSLDDVPEEIREEVLRRLEAP